ASPQVNVAVYDPTQGTSPVATYSDVSSVPLGMTDHPVIVQVGGSRPPGPGTLPTAQPAVTPPSPAVPSTPDQPTGGQTQILPAGQQQILPSGQTPAAGGATPAPAPAPSPEPTSPSTDLPSPATPPAGGSSTNPSATPRASAGSPTPMPTPS